MFSIDEAREHERKEPRVSGAGASANAEPRDVGRKVQGECEEPRVSDAGASATR